MRWLTLLPVVLALACAQSGGRQPVDGFAPDTPGFDSTIPDNYAGSDNFVAHDPGNIQDTGNPGDTKGDTAVIKGKYPPSASPAQQAALKALNKVRRELGLSIADESAQLNKSAQAHADFVTNHCREYDGYGLSPHEEDPSYGDDFTGKWPWDRAAAAGYHGQGVGEVIAFFASPGPAVDAWVNSLYHRLLILDMGLQVIGYGKSVGQSSCPWPYGKMDVMDLGLGAPPQNAPRFVLYPHDGAVGVPRKFEGYESPQPPKPKDGYPAGTMITLQLRDSSRFQWTEHKIIELDNQWEVPHMAVSNVPNTDVGIEKDPQAMQGMRPYLALYPDDPLKPDTKYRVVIGINLGGQNLGVRTTFTTGN